MIGPRPFDLRPSLLTRTVRVVGDSGGLPRVLLHPIPAIHAQNVRVGFRLLLDRVSGGGAATTANTVGLAIMLCDIWFSCLVPGGSILGALGV